MSTPFLLEALGIFISIINIILISYCIENFFNFSNFLNRPEPHFSHIYLILPIFYFSNRPTYIFLIFLMRIPRKYIFFKSSNILFKPYLFSSSEKYFLKSSKIYFSHFLNAGTYFSLIFLKIFYKFVDFPGTGRFP